MLLKTIDYKELLLARDILQGEFRFSQTSKNDSDVISFTHGNGVRYPDYLDKYSFNCSKLHKYNILTKDKVMAVEYKLRKLYKQYDKDFCLTLGAVDGLQTYFKCWVKASDCVIVTPGFFHSITTWVCFLNVPILLLPIKNTLSESEKEKIIESFNSISKKFRFIHLIITNPSISGNLYKKNLIDFIKINSPINSNIVYDYIFYPIYTENYNDSENVIDFSNNEIGVFSLTKSHGLSAQPFGCMFGSKNILNSIKEYLAGHRGRFPIINLEIALSALIHGRNYIRVNNTEINLRRNIILSKISPEYHIIKVIGKPIASHSITIKLPLCKRENDIRSFSIQHIYNLLNHYKVAVSPGITNGEPDGSIRINFADCGDDFHLVMSTQQAFEHGRRKMLDGINRVIQYAKDISNHPSL